MIIEHTLSRFFRTMSRKLRCSAAQRNKSYILEVIQKHFDPQNSENVLEISSGTGEHIAYFAEHFPKLTFIPSEYDMYMFDSIKAHAEDIPTKNIKDPLKIDVTTPWETWNLNNQCKYMININMIHITPHNCTVGLFHNASSILKPGGLMITYGPYACNGVLTPQSNINFDKSLRRQDPEWGIRDITHLKKLALDCGIKLLHIYDLPANNKCLVWQKINPGKN